MVVRLFNVIVVIVVVRVYICTPVCVWLYVCVCVCVCVCLCVFLCLKFDAYDNTMPTWLHISVNRQLTAQKMRSGNAERTRDRIIELSHYFGLEFIKQTRRNNYQCRDPMGTRDYLQLLLLEGAKTCQRIVRVIFRRGLASLPCELEKYKSHKLFSQRPS